MSEASHQPAPDAEPDRQPFSVRVVCNRNEVIHGADSWFEVVSGSVRACRILKTGRRQVVQLYLPGDMFGFDDVNAMLGLTTEAAADQQTVLIRHWRDRLNARIALDPVLGLRLRGLALYRLAATRNRLAKLGLLTPVEKVWDFLMEMKDRLVLQADPDGRPVVAIPIETRDIEDYLDIKPEILHRSLQTLRQRGAIELVAPGRIKLLNESAFVLSAASFPPIHHSADTEQIKVSGVIPAPLSATMRTKRHRRHQRASRAKSRGAVCNRDQGTRPVDAESQTASGNL